MREIASADIHTVVNELRPKITGAFVKKFYDLGSGAFRFGFHGKAGNTAVYCRLLSTFNETSLSESAGEPTQFAMGMRKRIEGAKVLSVEQHGADRIIVLELSAGDSSRKLIIEMFGKGNMILADGNGLIELAYASLSFKDREIRPRAKYSFPKSESVDVWSAGKEQVYDAVRSVKGKAKAMSELSKSISIGPLYLEDSFNRAGIDPKGRVESDADADKLASFVNKAIEGVANPSPRIYRSGENVVDYALIPIKKYDDAGDEPTKYASLSAALDEMHSTERSQTGDNGRARKLAELNSNIARQEELARQLKEEAEAYGRAGGIVFNNMDEINEIIAYLRENRRATLEELRSRFKGLKIKGLDLKNKTVTIEMES